MRDDVDAPGRPLFAQRARMSRARLVALVVLVGITVFICAGIAWSALI